MKTTQNFREKLERIGKNGKNLREIYLVQNNNEFTKTFELAIQINLLKFIRK